MEEKLIKHVIVEIKYEENYLLRTCGWEGKASDINDHNKHNKECPTYNEPKDFNPEYGGIFMNQSKVH